MVAVGPRARWLTADHPADDAYGPASPFARLVAADGQVLMLGAPLDTVTLLHHAEAIAHVEDKRRSRTACRCARATAWSSGPFTDIDTSGIALPYERLGPADDPFAVIAAGGAGRAASACADASGAAESHLFPAPPLTAFAVAWMEERFGPARWRRGTSSRVMT